MEYIIYKNTYASKSISDECGKKVKKVYDKETLGYYCTYKDCNRLKCYEISDRNRRVYKCLNYGESNAETTDWRLSYKACGTKDKAADKPAIKIYVANQKEPQIKGQIKILGGIYNE